MILYKYLTAERVDVLRGGMIRFTPAVALNDPFECRVPFERLVKDGEGFAGEMNSLVARVLSLDADSLTRACRETLNLLLDERALTEAVDLLDAEQRAVLRDAEQQAKVIARLRKEAAEFRPNEFASQFNRAVADVVDICRELGAQSPALLAQLASLERTHFGVLCLSESRESETMWSHYADSHRGFAIGFSECHPWFDRRKSPGELIHQLRPVRYVAHRPAFETWEEAMEHVFWTKGDQWAYERERRMIAPLVGEDGEPAADRVIGVDETAVHLFRFPASAVGEVVRGCRMPDEQWREIETLVACDPRYAHVGLIETVLDEQRGVLTFHRS
jgi:hypothetical protein